MQEFTDIKLSLLAGHGLMAIFGGIVHALNAQRLGKTKSIWDILVLSFISSFCGMIFALVSLYFFDNQYITLAFTGCGGYLGTEGMAMVIGKLQEIFTKK